ncbi:hypothetical protein HO173_001060 [Letharia columbiana]|uniref:CRAL-TRIO domain-containing protein n=1 Tax=Letharia columbiana TaxID=112416 RepID=A0A8H6L9Z6_9LECA|nr:uncharacterized protein HO173_001060 [Letharia columbiana]KAF6241265.1 hypothetical protein HO173_001060 [Letharia columbiana]
MYSRSILRPLSIRLQHHPAISRSRSVSRISASPHTAWRQPYHTLLECRWRIVQSGLSGPTTVILLLASLVGGFVYLYQPTKPPEHEDSFEGTEDYKETEEYAIMPGAALPGRPGNLTKEQELRLQEMWTATLKVFGVSGFNDGTNGDAVSITGSETAEQAGTVGSEKKKKKRVNLFSRKQHDDVGTEDAKSVSATDANDKYGQAKEFHKVLESQSPEAIRTAFWSMVKHDDPDGLLLRFLRARKWNVQNALIMLISTMHWRMQEMHVDDDIVRRGEAGALDDSINSNSPTKKEGHDFLTQMRLGKSFLHGTDKEGRPLTFVRVKLHKQGEQSEASLERFTVYTIETARLLLSPNVDTAAIIFDMTDFSMANLDYGPVKFMIKVFEANYPESLGVVLVHKSPWMFQGVWKLIRGWLDPVVAGKVHFTKNVEELAEFVERSHIIRELGGDDPWTYQYVEPVAGENKLQSDGVTRQRLLDERAAVVKDYEATTQQWIRDPNSTHALQQRRSELTKRLRTGYWELDPYLRARTLYDRTGIIREGGQIQYYGSPNSATGSNAGHHSIQNGPLPPEHRADELD